MKKYFNAFTTAGAGHRLTAVKYFARNAQIMREVKGVKREGFNKENIPARSAHKGLIATLVLRLAMNATARACGQKRVWLSQFSKRTETNVPFIDVPQAHRRALVSPLRFVASLGLAFTMAEILLSLTIIGVVAAITLPSLTGNINERTWNTQRKALYSRMSQAISLMPALNGYGTVDDTTDTAAETFITNGLSKVLQINNICDNTHLQDCGIPAKITTVDTSKIDFPATMQALNPLMVGNFNNTVQSFSIKNTKAAAFETKNGESIVAYHNPYCIGGLQDMQYERSSSGAEAGSLFQRTVCANFVYDLNGKKGPNTVGKDIGVMTVIYPSDPTVVAPSPAPQTLAAQNLNSATRACTTYDPDYRMPNLEEMYSVFVNKLLFKPSGFNGGNYWSSHKAIRPNGTAVGIGVKMNTGELDDWTLGNGSIKTWCVKR